MAVDAPYITNESYQRRGEFHWVNEPVFYFCFTCLRLVGHLSGIRAFSCISLLVCVPGTPGFSVDRSAEQIVISGTMTATLDLKNRKKGFVPFADSEDEVNPGYGRDYVSSSVLCRLKSACCVIHLKVQKLVVNCYPTVSVQANLLNDSSERTTSNCAAWGRLQLCYD